MQNFIPQRGTNLETKSELTTWRTIEADENMITYMIDRSSSNETEEGTNMVS